jgi:penicillin-binding protein 1C
MITYLNLGIEMLALRRIPKIKKWSKRLMVVLGVYFMVCLPDTLFEDDYSTVLEDTNGQVLMAHIASDGQWRFPVSDSIPIKFSTALIAFEDRRYYQHHGVSILALGRAVVQNFRSKRLVSGGSTLSMQVIRMSRKRTGRSIKDKLKEMVMAFRLETKYSKDEILTLHASHAPFGGNVVGLEAASWRYFGHSAHKLSWAESAMLAVLPNAPSLMHLSKNRQALLDKRNRLLTRLYESKTLSLLEFETAIEEPLPDKPQPLPQITPHYMAYFAAQGFSGSRITTTINSRTQRGVNSIVNRHYQRNITKGIANMSVVVLDVQTLDVLAYVGNTPCIDEHKPHVDIVQAPRSTGSILKPFLYGKAMENGQLTPQTLVADYPTRINGYAPQNYEESYDGMVPASQALARSLNIPAVRLLSDYGVTRLKQNLQEFGLKTLFRPAEQYGLSLILGGAEASLWDLSHAYAKVSACAQSSEYKELMSPAVAYEVLEAMSSVNRPIVEQYWNRFDGKQKIAWKTGTSYGARDAWAIGVTKKYVVAVWVGNASGEGVPRMTGSSTAAPVLFDVFQLLPKSEWFTKPTRDMQFVKLCKQSGQRYGQHCNEEVKGYLPNACMTAPSCQFHQKIHVSKISGERVFASCETPSNTTTKSWFVIPTAAESYYKSNHPEYQPLPKFKKNCAENTQDLDVLYPLHNSVIHIPKLLSGDKGNVIFEAVHRRSDVELFWYIDKTFLTTTTDIHQVDIQPTKGKHRLTVTDEHGFEVVRRFEVI